MRFPLLRMALTVAIAGSCFAALAQTTGFNPLSGHPGHLARLRDYRTMRVSSEDRPGNADRLQFEPHETKTIAQLEGPGEITHLWTTIATADKKHLRNIVIRIYWDGNKFPSVESPIGDFYGLGHAKYYYFNNPVQAIGTINGMNAFWPMPFAKSARVEISNESDVKTDAFYFYVDWRKLKTFPTDAGYFHASYRQAFPNADGKPYLIMETDGGRGHFCGVSLNIHTQVGGWWGEGDDIFTIDGEATPSLWGTGSEDYFCGAWCYGETFYNDYFGMPLRERIDHNANNYWNVYRLHLESPVTFEKSLKVEIEHGANGFENTRGGRNNDYSSVAYWYQQSPQPLKAKLPPATERMSVFEAPKKIPGVTEGHSMQVPDRKGLNVDQQNMVAFQSDTRKWLNGDQLFAAGEVKDGVSLELKFNLEEDQSGDAVLRLTRAPDYAKVDIELDGKPVAKGANLFAAEVEPVLLKLGKQDLKKGEHTLRVTVAGKDERSKNLLWGLDYLRVGGEALADEAQTPVLEIKTTE